MKILPRRDGSLRSGTFVVKCGEYAQITGYGLCPGVCVKFNRVHDNKCACEYNEKPYCIAGAQLGIDAHCTDAIIPMPGTYVAYMCLADGFDLDDDFCVYAEVCTHVENLQAVIAAVTGN